MLKATSCNMQAAEPKAVACLEVPACAQLPHGRSPRLDRAQFCTSSPNNRSDTVALGPLRGAASGIGGARGRQR